MSLNDYSFADAMQSSRDRAARDRHRGKSAARPKYAKAPPAEDTEINRLYADIARLRSDIRDRDNTIAVLQSGGDPNEDFGSELDRLFASAKANPASLPAGGALSSSEASAPARTRQPRTMTKDQYLTALKKLDLTPASKKTAAALGLSVRQCLRLSAGTQSIPETVAKLITMYLKHGLMT